MTFSIFLQHGILFSLKFIISFNIVRKLANPLAQILSVAMLFEYFDLKEEGALIREAVDASLDANVRTPEIQVEGGAKYGTKEVGSWIVNYITEK